jgi:hypothetical protein
VPEADTEQENTVLKPEVVEQLHDFISNVAALYTDNPFHNFEHASHVTMSVVKLLSRIVAPHSVLTDEHSSEINLVSRNVKKCCHCLLQCKSKDF